MSLSLFKNLLSNQFYTDNQSKLSPHLWEGDLKEIYHVISKVHAQYEQDLTPESLTLLYEEAHPVATKAELDMVNSLIEDIGQEDPLSPEIAQDVISGLWKREAGRKIANLGLEISEGNYDGFTRLTGYLEKLEEGFSPTDIAPPEEFDLEELIKAESNEGRWSFNIASLRRKVYGIGPTEFAVVLATPETGKSAFCISLGAGPDGFAEQGAKCLYVVNEESHTKHQRRMASAYTGFTKDQLEKNVSNLKAAKSVLKSKDLFSKLDIRAGQGWSLSDLETHIKALKSDIVFIDQADKLSVAGSFEANHHKLRELYLQLREIAKRQQCAIIAVSQASQSAIGKTRVMPSDAEGSRIGKFAEADLVFGIGKYDDESSGEEGDDHENTSRFITVGKNKLNGYHGTVVCKIEPQRSRYVE